MKKYIKKTKVRNLLIVLHILFVFFGFLLYLANYGVSESLLVQKTLNKQLILAKAGSSSAENLFLNLENQLSSFVFSFTTISEDALINRDATRAEFISYMKRAQLPINGIALYDEGGKLLIIENRKSIHVGENKDFSKAPFIKWSQAPENKGKIFVSTPYIGTTGASVGKVILIVAKPVYFGNRYKGTLTIRLLVDDFSRAFVEPLASDADEDSFIVNKQGVLIAGRASLVNTNLYLYAQKQRWNHYREFTQKFSRALIDNTTQTSWTFQNPNEKSRVVLVGVSKIDLPETNVDLYMVVTTSKEGATSLLSPLRGYGVVWLGIGLLTTTVGGLMVMMLR